MADLWLERELARQLAPVAAPESLWERINHQQRGQRRGEPRRRISFDRAFWPITVAMVLFAFAGVLRTFSGFRDPETLTDRSGRFDLRSDNFEDIRAWAKTEANIDIDVPSGQLARDRGDVRLLGARLIRRRGLPVAAIDYRVGDEAATLFVSGKRAGLSGTTEAAGHLFSQTRSTGDARLVSWNMRNQNYTIAFSGAGNAHAACLLCHTTSPG
jgi:hypothetical protein